MVATGGRRPPWSVGTSLTFCSIALLQTSISMYIASSTKTVQVLITHLEQVITRQREEIN